MNQELKMSEVQFNPQQLEAINSDADAILCLAGAGVGKTATLTGRISRLVDNGVDPETILALTFTNAAAFEMKQRYKKLQGAKLGKKLPEFRTFHGFCYNVIIKTPAVREKMGYEKVPQVCDESDFVKLKKELIEKLGLTISEVELESESTISKEHDRQIQLFRKALRKEMRERNLITFDMMCYNVSELFVQDDESIQWYKHHYKYIMLDESQDTDPRQFKFVGSFGSNVSYFIVGDILQSIYQFRGCTNEFIKTLAEAPTWKLIKMYKNYRSTKQICDFANKFSHYAKDVYRIEMEGQRDGDEVEVIRGACAGYGDVVDEKHLQLLAEKIKADPVDSAVLCRTNKEVTACVQYLKTKGIECSRSSKEKETSYLLNCALDNNYMKDWLSTFLEGPKYADYIRLATLKKDKADLRWFLSLYGEEPKIKKRVNTVIKIRKIASDESAGVDAKLEDLKQVLKVKESKEFTLDANMTSRQLIESLRDQVLEDEETSVYCGTIHSAKGLEYDHVYVMGVNDKYFQLGNEEMNNLYYVAITRPREHLTVFRR